MGKWDKYLVTESAPDPEATQRAANQTTGGKSKWDAYRAATKASAQPLSKVKDIRPTTPPDGSEPAPEKDAMDPSTQLGAATRGAIQGGTFRFGDEIGAGAMMVPEAVGRLSEKVGLIDRPKASVEGHLDEDTAQAAQDKARGGLGDVYRKLRDSLRTDNKTAESAHPTTYGLSEAGAGMAMPVPGSGLMKGAPLVAKMGLGLAQGAGMGAVLGAGGSEADTLDGIKDDAITGAAFTAPLGVAGGVVAQAGDGLAARFGGKVAAASSKADSIVEKEGLKVYRKAIGGLGGEVSAGRNADQVMAEIINSPLSSAGQKEAAQSLVDDPARLAMLKRVYDNAIQGFPGRMGSMMNAEKGVQEAAARNTPEALSAAREELLADPISKRVIPSLVGRAKRHIIPAIGTAVGGSLGVAAAHLVGVEPGYGLAAGLGAGKLLGHTSKELLSHPGVQQAVFGALESTSSGLSRLLAKSGVTISAQSSPEEKLGIIEKAASASSAVAQAIRGLTEDDPQTIEQRFNR